MTKIADEDQFIPPFGWIKDSKTGKNIKLTFENTRHVAPPFGMTQREWDRQCGVGK